MSVEVDYLVIGSGLAGLTFALNVAQSGSVALLTKKTRTDANSSWAQGGIAGVIAEDDSFEMHTQDTLIAGAGLCNEEAVGVLVREGPQRILELIQMGAHFDTETDAEGLESLSLGREGGHSRNRIVHTADFTGWECERTLLEAVKANPNIHVYEHYFVTDLQVVRTADGPVCTGAWTLDVQTNQIHEFRAKAILLATGGSGQVYQHTTNPLVATGDGVAMAWRAGATLSNLEFVQFHPTTLYHPEARAFLITEALRGEGGILRHADGETFMERYHPLKELAPRDIVARAIVSEIKRREVPCVYLDVSHVPEEKIRAHFPTVYERCLSVGIDITKEAIPVVPAQHYQCGGVVTDLDGKTDIIRLFAAGEVACTGVHGANRLASNSLLEAMVFGYRAAIVAREYNTLELPEKVEAVTLPPCADTPEELPATIQLLRETVQKTLQKDVGIVRTTQELTEARQVLLSCIASLSGVDGEGRAEYWEARNIAQVGLLIIESALRRHESRGLHYSLDYPAPLESERHDTILQKGSL